MTPDNPSIQSHVNADLVRHLYTHLPISQVASSAALVAIVVAMWQDIPGQFLGTWIFLHFLVTVARLMIYAVFKHQGPATPDQVSVWGRRYGVGVTAAGLVWGWACFELMQVGDISSHMLVLFALGGILVGASQAQASQMRFYLSFTIPLALPVVAWLAIHGHGVYPFMALLLCFFFLASWQMDRIFHNALVDSFRLRYENLDLINSLGVEIQTREFSESLVQSHNRILEMLATQSSTLAVMNAINQMLEERIPGALSSIMLLNNTHTKLLSTAGPSLPDTYMQAVNGIEIGPEVGSCGSAAYLNQPVFVDDISAHPYWKNFKDIALAHGLKACHSMPIRDVNGVPVGSFGIYFRQIRALSSEEDACLQSAAHLAGVVAERIKLEEKLHHLAHYDALTGLPNRTLFMDRVHQAEAWARRTKHKFALLYIDLDKFKEINDQHGHGVGDIVLQEAAKRLRSCMRDVDTAARMGGDEFTVILAEIQDNRAPMLVAGKLISTLSSPIEIEGAEYTIGASIGISIYPTDSRDSDKLIGLADAAMYRAKQAGGNVSMLYSATGTRQKRSVPRPDSVEQ